MVTAAQHCEYTKNKNKKPTEWYTYIKHINVKKKNQPKSSSQQKGGRLDLACQVIIR